MDLYKESHSLMILNCDSENISLEKFLYGKEISGRLFRKLYKRKHIYVNGEHVKKTSHLYKGDKVTIYMEDEENNIAAEKMDLNIVYEDHDLLVVNKQSDTVVHPTKSHQKGTLSNGISQYFKENGINKKIRFVNRLDMDTTGILIVAKNPFGHQKIGLQLEEKTVVKKYFCIVEGIIEKDEGIIDLPIGREEDGSIKKIVTNEGQRALTTYKVKERYKNATLVEVQIFTGRSHQIRVHMAHLGHPIIGDSLYNKESPYIKRQALHSYYLKVKHPRKNDYIEFIAPLPQDMEHLIDLME